uniref:Uncharacterized protein n=1 Tax=Rhizophora mucronata TaxID=61149 RepID=A0A2P2IWL2_RHIMU
MIVLSSECFRLSKFMFERIECYLQLSISVFVFGSNSK